ncbi:MAG: tryptophan synthase subunit alpha [Candidatus Puniceispirillales bacterium]
MALDRIETCFSNCQAEQRAALGIFVSAGDPNLSLSTELLLGLPDAGADFVELGMPFSDPMADGPVIQAASLRAIKAGITMDKVLEMARLFRAKHPNVPLILMGYFNPIYIYGVDRFLDDATASGVDGLIMVDLPPEEDSELCIKATDKGLAFIRLITPTTNDKRMPVVVENASGFVYYVSITGITGSGRASADSIADAMAHIRGFTNLPAVVGFGIKHPDHVRDAGKHADGVVVGSAVVSIIADNLADDGTPAPDTADKVFSLIRDLKTGTSRL